MIENSWKYTVTKAIEYIKYVTSTSDINNTY